MCRRVLIWSLATLGLLTLLVWGYAASRERQMDATPLVEQLDATPIPDGLVLIDEWSHDGDWLIKPREPEAVRLYLTIGTVDETCVMLDEFYTGFGFEVRPTFRSDDPPEWCGRRVVIEGGGVSLSVEPVRSWREIPEHLVGQEPLVEVRYDGDR